MSKSILSKVAAVACSVASVIALSVCASAEKLEVNSSNYDLDAEKTNLVATKVELSLDELKAASYKVKYDVEVQNNKGFAPAGVRLVYPSDSKFTTVKNEDDEPGTAGPVAQPISPYITDNTAEYNVSIGTMGMKNSKDDGIFFTVEFQLPSTVKEGDTFPMKVEVDKFLDKDNNPVAYKTVDGYIKIKGVTTTAPVPTTAPVTSTTAKSTTVTSTTAPAPASSTTVTTTSASAVAPATTSTTVSTSADGTASAKTTTAAAGGTAANKTTKAGATQTGDTGAGVAVAALLLAAGTAVAAAKKKED